MQIQKKLKKKSHSSHFSQSSAKKQIKNSIQRGQELSQEISLLGNAKTDYPNNYAPQVLESFSNQHPQSRSWTSLLCTEFTSLCPKTGQPDFARIIINYIADKRMVESKSLKIYLFSFRNHGDFHEDCIQKICNDLFDLMSPHYIEVIGEFTPRGGITIYPFCSRSNKLKENTQLKNERFKNYAPGRYSMDFGRIY